MKNELDPFLEGFLLRVRDWLRQGQPETRRKVVQTCIELQKILGEG